MIMPTSPGALVDALTTTWKRLRADLPELPDAHIAVVTTPSPADHGPMRFHLVNEVLEGVVVSSECLVEGPEAVVTCLLHEAAHVLSWVRDVQDTASRGYYHNETFRNAAAEVGLEWPEERERDKARGYPDPQMAPATKDRHAADMQTLSEIIPTALPHLTPPRGRAPRTTGSRPSAQCGCTPPRKIWAAQSTLDMGSISCGVCGQSFT